MAELSTPLIFQSCLSFCIFQVARLETQVIRFKSSAETAERSEEELKTERRKLQREVKTQKQTETKIE
jgi:hypothetical protein